MLLHSKICLSSAKGRESVRSPAPQCVKKASKSPDMCKGADGLLSPMAEKGLYAAEKYGIMKTAG